MERRREEEVARTKEGGMRGGCWQEEKVMKTKVEGGREGWREGWMEGGRARRGAINNL